MLKDFCQLQLLLFKQFVIEIYLIAIITFHILPVAEHCAEVHVQQCGTAVYVELACRYAVFGKVFRVFCVVVAC